MKIIKRSRWQRLCG